MRLDPKRPSDSQLTAVLFDGEEMFDLNRGLTDIVVYTKLVR